VTDTTKVLAQRCAHCGTAAAPGIAFCANCGASLDLRTDDDALQSTVRALFGRDLDIERELGRGGMAAVYGAFDPELQRRVAVKVLLPELAENTEIVERFRREARTVAALQHPNIVSVFAVRTNAEMSAIIMQFVDGRSLDVALRDEPRLPLSAAGMVLSQVAEALEHAHERGVIHRDVKPANVLLDRDGHAVVSDFGIARREGGTRITDTGVVMGTIAYMSPEQCLGGAVTTASDQYSFGVMAFELLAGRRPFADGPVIDMLRAHVDQAPPNLGGLRSELPDAVVSWIMRSLEKDPAARHPDFRDARRVFAALVGNAKSTTKVIASLASAAATLRVADAPTLVVPVPRRSRVAALVGLAVVVLGGSVGAWGYLHRSTPTLVSPVAPVAQQAVAKTPVAPETRTPKRTAVTSTAALPPVSKPANDSVAAAPKPVIVVRDTVAVAAPASVPAPVAAPPAAPAVAAALADARAVAREFVTICNQRRTRDLEQLAALGGDAALRAELLRLVRTAPEFAAGFERVASSPVVSGDRFTTEFVIDLEWRGGQQLATVQLQAAQQNGAWHVTAFGVSAAP
jgi:hypothetical protein